MTFDLPLVIN
jgi:hypothetical protein